MPGTLGDLNKWGPTRTAEVQVGRESLLLSLGKSLPIRKNSLQFFPLQTRVQQVFHLAQYFCSLLFLLAQGHKAF